MTGSAIANLLWRRPRGGSCDERRRWRPAPTTIRELIGWDERKDRRKAEQASASSWSSHRLRWDALGAPRTRRGRMAPLSLSAFPVRPAPLATPPDIADDFADFCRHGVKLLDAAKAPYELDEPLPSMDASVNKMRFVQAVDRRFRELAGGMCLEDVMGGQLYDSAAEWSNYVSMPVWEVEGFNDDHVTGLLELLDACRDAASEGPLPKRQPGEGIRLPAAAVETLCPGAQVRVRTDGREEIADGAGTPPAGPGVMRVLELKALEATFGRIVRARQWAALGRDWGRALTFLSTWRGTIYVHDMSEIGECDIDYFGGLAGLADECRLHHGMQDATWPLIKRCSQGKQRRGTTPTPSAGEEFWRDLARRLRHAQTT